MLTGKQEAFARCVAEGMTYVDAYRAAYDTQTESYHTMQRSASRTAHKPEIEARIRELRDMAAQESVMNARQRRAWLSAVIRDPEAKLGEKLRASDQLNKMDGEYVQRVEADVKREIFVNIELTDEDA